MLQNMAFDDPDLAYEEKAFHLSALRSLLDVLATQDSPVAEAVEQLIDEGVIVAPSYAGVRPVALLLQMAMLSPLDYPDLADLLTTPRLLAALDELDFPLSAKRIKHEVAIMRLMNGPAFLPCSISGLGCWQNVCRFSRFGHKRRWTCATTRTRRRSSTRRASSLTLIPLPGRQSTACTQYG
jgi:hypothetical protein